MIWGDARQPAQGGVQIFRRGDLLKGHAGDLILRVAGDGGKSIVAFQEAAFAGGKHDADRRLLKGGAVALLALGEPVGGLFQQDLTLFEGGDVDVLNDGAGAAVVLKPGDSAQEPAHLVLRVARVFLGELFCVSAEHGANAGGKAGGFACLRTARSIAHVQIVGAFAEERRHRKTGTCRLGFRFGVGVGKGAPGLVDSDDGAAMV